MSGCAHMECYIVRLFEILCEMWGLRFGSGCHLLTKRTIAIRLLAFTRSANHWVNNFPRSALGITPGAPRGKILTLDILYYWMFFTSFIQIFPKNVKQKEADDIWSWATALSGKRVNNVDEKPVLQAAFTFALVPKLQETCTVNHCLAVNIVSPLWTLNT